MLLLNSDRTTQAIYSWILEERGIDVVTALSIDDALAQIWDTIEGAVIDLGSAEENYRAVAAIHEVCETQPFLIVVGNEGPDYDQSCLDAAGVTAFLHKPLNKDELLELLKHLSPDADTEVPLPGHTEAVNEFVEQHTAAEFSEAEHVGDEDDIYLRLQANYYYALLITELLEGAKAKDETRCLNAAEELERYKSAGKKSKIAEKLLEYAKAKHYDNIISLIHYKSDS